MDNELEKRYGFPHALSMVVGIVTGCGIFFKASKGLEVLGGSMLECLLAMILVGLICLVCSYLFALLASRYVKCIGIIDYSNVSVGPRYSYFVGWFLSVMYYPVISSMMCYMAAKYTCLLLGFSAYGTEHTIIAFVYLLLCIFVNSISPRIAGRIQILTTIIKLMPIFALAIGGTYIGIKNGNGLNIFTDTSAKDLVEENSIFTAICAFVFIFEGWGIATSINSELKNPKRDLPKALMIGTIFCIIIYLLYTYSLGATLTAEEIVSAGYWLPQIAFTNLFHNNLAGVIVYVFIVISCLGAANGIVFAGMRSFYALAIRNQGPNPKEVARFNHKTKMPTRSCILGGVMALFWLFQCSILYYNGPLVMDRTGLPVWLMGWEADELVIMLMYLFYIPIFAHIFKAEEDFNFFQRYILSIIGIACSIFIFISTIIAYGASIVLSFLATFAIIMGLGAFFYRKDPAIK